MSDYFRKVEPALRRAGSGIDGQVLHQVASILFGGFQWISSRNIKSASSDGPQLPLDFLIYRQKKNGRANRDVVLVPTFVYKRMNGTLRVLSKLFKLV